MTKIIQLKKIEKDFNYFVDELISLCQEDLSLINSVILDKLDSKISLIQEIASHLILSGGKRLRPLLTCCSFKCVKINSILKKNI